MISLLTSQPREPLRVCSRDTLTLGRCTGGVTAAKGKISDTSQIPQMNPRTTPSTCTRQDLNPNSEALRLYLNQAVLNRSERSRNLSLPTGIKFSFASQRQHQFGLCRYKTQPCPAPAQLSCRSIPRQIPSLTTRDNGSTAQTILGSHLVPRVQTPPLSPQRKSWHYP